MEGQWYAASSLPVAIGASTTQAAKGGVYLTRAPPPPSLPQVVSSVQRDGKMHGYDTRLLQESAFGSLSARMVSASGRAAGAGSELRFPFFQMVVVVCVCVCVCVWTLV